jgi:ferritin-like metal-binding protein YciE
MNMHLADRMFGLAGRSERNLRRTYKSGQRESRRMQSLIGMAGLAGIGYLAWRMASGGRGQGGAPDEQSTDERWWRNLVPHMSEAARIDSLQALYISELQELRHADGEVTSLLNRLARAAANEELGKRLRRHKDKVELQRRRVREILQQFGAEGTTHRDNAMRALEAEAEKMLKIKADPMLRDAAIVASFQRIVHYRIATLGTLAAYAQLLGRDEESSELAEWSDAEGGLDHDLTELAEATINRGAAQTAHIA